MPQVVYILALFVALTFTGCIVDYEYDAPEDSASRTLLVYLGGDNNLSNEATAKMHALREGWSGKANEQVVVYLDRYGRPPQLIEFVGTSADHALGLRTVEIYDDENSASAEVFGRVIDKVLADYLADKYNLLVFSHASGWLPESSLTNPYTRSVIIDGTQEMELTDFAAAIPDGMFGSIIFETCFMAGIEVAYELRNKADYILASSAEILSPGFTNIYRNNAARLFGGNPRDFGMAVFDNVLTYVDDNLRRSATYSVIRTARLESLAAFIRNECHFGVTVDVSDIQHFDRYAYRLFFDFGDYYGRLLPNDRKRAELAALIDACVIWRAATPEFMTQQTGYNGFLIEQHSGLTTYIPQPQFEGLNDSYRSLAWSMATMTY